MKDDNAIKKFMLRMKNDYAFRTFISAAVSFIATIIFTLFNLYLGIAYRAEWNLCIAAYYALLVAIRAFVIIHERKISRGNYESSVRDRRRKDAFLIQSILLFITDFALITPVSLMVLQRKAVSYSAIPAIAVAAYTTYKIIVSARNYFKAEKQQNLSVRMLKDISLIDAAVSVLSLQYTLIMTFGDGIQGNMLTLCAVTSLIIWLLLLAFSTSVLVFAIRRRNMKSCDNTENE